MTSVTPMTVDIGIKDYLRIVVTSSRCFFDFASYLKYESRY